LIKAKQNWYSDHLQLNPVEEEKEEEEKEEEAAAAVAIAY